MAKRRSKEEERQREYALEDEERVVLRVSPPRAGTLHKYLLTLGLWAFWRKRNSSVVTNRRIMTGRGFYNREEHSIPMNFVEDVQFRRKGLNSYARVSVYNHGRRQTENIGPLTAKSARRFATAVLRASQSSGEGVRDV
jgi:hypothetical protein